MRSKAVLPFLGLAAIALGMLAFRLLVWGSQEITQAPQAVAQPDAIVQGAGRLTLEDLQAFDRFRVFWVGPEWEGRRLAKIQYLRSAGSPDGLVPRSEYILIQYGTCDPGEGPPEEEGGCVRPLNIYSEPLCLNPPSRLAEGARQGPPLEVRGALVQNTTSDNLHVYFGESTVVIIAAEGNETALEAVGNLTGVNRLGQSVAASAGAPLGPPMAEANCENFALPPIPQATPTPTAEPAAVQ